MNNADGKSPCDVYVVLMAQCDTRNCLRTDVSPRTYLRQCNESFPQTFPCPLPPDVAIPGWAYQSVVVNDLFNVTLASQFTNRETTSLSTVPDHGHSSFGATSTAAASSATQILTISPSAPATAPQPSVQLTAISSSQSTLTQTNSLGKTTVPQTGGSSPSRLSTGPSGPAIPASSTTFLLTTPAVATTTISESVQSNASINQAKSPGPLIGAVTTRCRTRE
ncbi:hypothetical protein GY45DRAFT_1061001 [Cubamyces sp. BRFM 1775]|nr:hypothetical protein GY45DRAFT_1061001 [Cubamyces sp. BRFM 1775]